MKERTTWDWHTDLKEIPVREWQDRFNWVQEPRVSPDGERIAAVVNQDEMEFSVCVNGEAWDKVYEKAWHLMALPDNRFGVCGARDEEWTVAVDGEEWTNWFDFVWDLRVSPDGASLGAAFQSDMTYGVVVDDTPWENRYESMTGVALAPGGGAGAVVQVAPMAAADVDAFKQGLFAVAVNGDAKEQQFLNAWDISFDPEGGGVGYAVRFDRETYGIVQGDGVWDTKFQCVWKPEFLDRDTLVAPVRLGGKWHLYKNDAPFWRNPCIQVWKLLVSPVNQDVAAVVSPAFGKWTVAKNDTAWDLAWDGMIAELRFSSDGSSLAAVGKHNGGWDLAVDGKAWGLGADMVFSPVLSDDGSVVAAAAEKQGRYQVVVNGNVLASGYSFMAEPVISPDNANILVKGIENGIYKRRVISL